jgi:hypothetical protein
VAGRRFDFDEHLRRTLEAFREVQVELSPIAFNDGKPLGPIALQRAVYHRVKGRLNSQMTISAIRQVAAAYAKLSATSIGLRNHLSFAGPEPSFWLASAVGMPTFAPTVRSPSGRLAVASALLTPYPKSSIC